MNPANSFEAFVSLATLDQKIVSLQRTSDALSKKKESLVSTLDTQKRFIYEREAIVATLQKTINSLELELKSILDKEQKKKKQIDQVSSTREYQSIHQELVDLEAKKTALEEEIINQWQKLEQAQGDLKEISAKTESILVGLQNEIKKINDEQELSQQERVAFENERLPLLEHIESSLLATYLNMKDRVANPAVIVESGRCTGCHYHISSQDLSELRHHKILVCKDCYRLLYMR